MSALAAAMKKRQLEDEAQPRRPRYEKVTSDDLGRDKEVCPFRVTPCRLDTNFHQAVNTVFDAVKAMHDLDALVDTYGTELICEAFKAGMSPPGSRRFRCQN